MSLTASRGLCHAGKSPKTSNNLHGCRGANSTHETRSIAGAVRHHRGGGNLRRPGAPHEPARRPRRHHAARRHPCARSRAGSAGRGHRGRQPAELPPCGPQGRRGAAPEGAGPRHRALPTRPARWCSWTSSSKPAGSTARPSPWSTGRRQRPLRLLVHAQAPRGLPDQGHAAGGGATQAARPPKRLYVVRPSAGSGARGTNVRALQRRLAELGYVTPVNGFYSASTARAVLAFRKVNGMGRNELRRRGGLQEAGAGRRRLPRSLSRSRQARRVRLVAAGAGAGARSRAAKIVHASSGKPSTPTVFGKFHFYSKTPGYNSHGMYYSNYFIGGYAIHGYAVGAGLTPPATAASGSRSRARTPSTTGSTSGTRSTSTANAPAARRRCRDRSTSEPACRGPAVAPPRHRLPPRRHDRPANSSWSQQ